VGHFEETGDPSPAPKRHVSFVAFDGAEVDAVYTHANASWLLQQFQRIALALNQSVRAHFVLSPSPGRDHDVPAAMAKRLLAQSSE
jgi:hypothetical protein